MPGFFSPRWPASSPPFRKRLADRHARHFREILSFGGSFVADSLAVSWGSVTLLNGFADEKEGRCFLASAAACQTVINAIEQ